MCRTNPSVDWRGACLHTDLYASAYPTYRYHFHVGERPADHPHVSQTCHARKVRIFSDRQRLFWPWLGQTYMPSMLTSPCRRSDAMPRASAFPAPTVSPFRSTAVSQPPSGRRRRARHLRSPKIPIGITPLATLLPPIPSLLVLLARGHPHAIGY